MRASEVRNWLGRYFLFATFALAVCMLFLHNFTPLDADDSRSAFEIVIPVLMGQLALVYQWFAAGRGTDERARVRVPSWVVKGPPILVVSLMGAAILALRLGWLNADEQGDLGAGESFKAVLTFCVAMLNATTVVLVAAYFQTKGQSGAPPTSARTRSQRPSPTTG